MNICTLTANPSVDLFLEVSRVAADDINRITGARRDPGGKGLNVSRALRELGHPDTIALGIAGGRNGAWLKGRLAREGLRHRFIAVPGETRVIFNIRESATGRLFRFNEPGPRVTAARLDKLAALAEATLEPGDYLAVCGSAPPGTPPDFYARLVRLARRRGAMTVLDCDTPLLAEAVAAGPDLIKPNLFELGRLAGATIASRRQAYAAARRLTLAGTGAAVVSFGARGALAVSAHEAFWARAPKVAAASTIGAGDALLAGLLFELARGAGLAEALKTAVAAGSASVTVPGTGFARKNLVLALRERVSVRAISAA